MRRMAVFDSGRPKMPVPAFFNFCCHTSISYICQVSFSYPLFLAAGLSLAIPVLIHLFNLRKYKTVLFPHTRFLKNIQLNSRRQSQIRYKWLLLSRLLFLAFVVLAFAQPYFAGNDAVSGGKQVQVIYLDNSYSMSATKGARRLLDIAKDAAARQVRSGAAGSRYVILTNDKPSAYRAMPATEAYNTIQATEITAATTSVDRVLAAAATAREHEQADKAVVYYYSDFQQSAFPAIPTSEQTRNIVFYGIPVQVPGIPNVYIDTVILTNPVLQADRSNYAVVRTRKTGESNDAHPVLNLAVNGQVKSAASLSFDESDVRTDTLSFQVSGNGWQQLSFTLNDATMRFDDTFRIAARCAPNLSVLVLNEGQMNPYIQAAFRAWNGFRINQTDVNASPEDWKPYSLVILNGITGINESLGKKLSETLNDGHTICIFPGRTANIGALNDGLKLIGDIQITGTDTSMQMASQLQPGSQLVKDLFEKVPDNVQLPTANWHYILSAGITANQQSVLSFRNGDPLLARYSPTQGALYLCATAADPESGNFPGSYFFTPFLYQMAMQGGGGNVYAVRAGTKEPTFVTLANATERNTMHAYANGTDIVPPQRPNGAGLDVYAGSVLQEPGFYALAAPATDTVQLAVNQDKAESDPNYRDIVQLSDTWKGNNIKWQEVNSSGNLSEHSGASEFPLWKVCVILALVMLGVETWLLARNRKRPA